MAVCPGLLPAWGRERGQDVAAGAHCAGLEAREEGVGAGCHQPEGTQVDGHLFVRNGGFLADKGEDRQRVCHRGALAEGVADRSIGRHSAPLPGGLVHEHHEHQLD